jgi:hypothetical protein
MAVDTGPFRCAFPLSLRAGDRARVTLSASISVCPARDIAGAPDPRELAYQLSGLELA